MGKVLREREVEALNVSIRHSPPDRDSMLPWAREDVFSFVLYYKQRTWSAAREAVGQWTRELIDAVLAHEGRYYRPYQLHATRSQFERAYPEAARFRTLKRQVDPAGRFSNELWRTYLEARSRLNATFFTVVFIGMAVGSVLGALLLEHAGVLAVFGLSALAAAAAWAVRRARWDVC
jgi:hypothetical protein